MKKSDFEKLYPEVNIGPYDLGKHWPEGVAFDQWLSQKIQDFKKHYEYLESYDEGSTYSGGTVVLLYGVEKIYFDHLMDGTACFLYPCTNHVIFDKPDDLAIHLVDRHQWDTEKARLWLRDTIEEDAFYEAP